jgi:hypothetical protein
MSHEVDELYAVYRVTVRRSRRDRHCCACGLQIHAGDRYADVRMVFNDKAETLHRCGRCAVVHAHLVKQCGSSDIWPDERLDCGLDYANEWGGDPPEDVQAVVFATSDEASALLVQP